MRIAIPLIFLSACAAPAAPPPAPATPPPRSADEVAMRVLSALEATFYTHWGSVEKTEPFGWLGPEHVPSLRGVADSGGPRSLMALRVLERLAPGEAFSTEAKAILYASALRRETDFSRWGVISKEGFLPGVYGHELTGLGKKAVPFLRGLLADRRRAPVITAPGALQNRIRRDRVCDYAWVIIAKILHRPTAYRDEPHLRDPQIRELGHWLDRR